MLRGDDHRVDADGLIVVIFDGDLRFSVCTQIGKNAALAYLGELLGKFLGQRNGQRHQFGRLVTGVAEDHTLIACAGVIRISDDALLGFKRLIYAERNIGGLLVDSGKDGAGIAVKALLRAVIADFTDGLPRNRGNIHIGRGSNLAHNKDHPRCSSRLTGNARVRILGKDRVQHRIRDLIAYFIGMSFGYRLTGEKLFDHLLHSPFYTKQNILPAERRKDIYHQNIYLLICRSRSLI